MKRCECQSVTAQANANERWKQVCVCVSVWEGSSQYHTALQLQVEICKIHSSQERSPFQNLQTNLPLKATHVNCASTHTHSSFLFIKGITLSIIVDRCSLQERDWKSSMHSREETEWGSNLWIIIGDVAIPKISTRGNSWICWLDNGGREKKSNSYIIEACGTNALCSYYSTELTCREG